MHYEEFFRFEKIRIIIKTIFVQVCVFCAAVFVIWGAQALYAVFDRTSFPEPMPIPENAAELSEKEKGVILADSIVWEMRRELDSSLGWTFNDIIFNRWLIDNRANRQYGVYHATKFLMDLYASQIAKLGASDKENDLLYKARINNFVIDPRSFMFPSAEGSYKGGVDLVDRYKKDLSEGKATYNCRTDDLYASFVAVTGENLLGYALGLLENAQGMNFSELDNRIYVVQGICLVVRDFVNTLWHLYPEIGNKSAGSMQAALGYLNQICDYDPLYITSWFNSGELVTSWLLFARARLGDVRDSIRI